MDEDEDVALKLVSCDPDAIFCSRSETEGIGNLENSIHLKHWGDQENQHDDISGL